MAAAGRRTAWQKGQGALGSHVFIVMHCDSVTNMAKLRLAHGYVH